MTRQKVPKAPKKPIRQATKRVRKPTTKQVEVAVTKAEENLELKVSETFPTNKPVGTIYIPTGSKSSWIKQEDGKWKEVKHEE